MKKVKTIIFFYIVTALAAGLGSVCQATGAPASISEALILDVKTSADAAGEILLEIDRGSDDGIIGGGIYNVFVGEIPLGLYTARDVGGETTVGPFIPITPGKLPVSNEAILLSPQEGGGETGGMAEADEAAVEPAETEAEEEPAGRGEEGRNLRRIKPGDVLGISSYPVDKLPEIVTVRPDGSLVLPIIGEIQAEGLTVFQLSDHIVNLMGEYVKSPWVDIRIVESSMVAIRVFGAVGRPGLVKLNQKSRFLDIIPEIGGLGAKADTGNLKLIRTDGSEKIVDINLIIENPGSPDNVLMRDGDIVYVPERTLEEERLRVLMVGLLNKQGVVYLDRNNARLLDAISEAGGLANGADINNVMLLKKSDTNINPRHLDIEKALTGEDFLGQNVVLSDGDTIYVTGEPPGKQKKINKANALAKEFSPILGAALIIIKLSE